MYSVPLVVTAKQGTKEFHFIDYLQDQDTLQKWLTAIKTVEWLKAPVIAVPILCQLSPLLLLAYHCTSHPVFFCSCLIVSAKHANIRQVKLMNTLFLALSVLYGIIKLHTASSSFCVTHAYTCTVCTYCRVKINMRVSFPSADWILLSCKLCMACKLALLLEWGKVHWPSAPEKSISLTMLMLQ